MGDKDTGGRQKPGRVPSIQERVTVKTTESGREEGKAEVPWCTSDCLWVEVTMCNQPIFGVSWNLPTRCTCLQVQTPQPRTAPPHPAPTAVSYQRSYVQVISDQDLIFILFLAVLVFCCRAQSSLVVVHRLSCPKAYGILVL